MAGTKMYRTKNGTHIWRLRAWDGTSQVSQTIRVVGGTKRASEVVANEELAKLAKRVRLNPGADPNRTLSDLWDAYRQQAEGQLSPTTLAGYRRRLENQILPTLGPVRLRDLTSHQLDSFYAAEQRRGLGARSVVHHHRVLSSLFRQAERWGWIEVSPTRNATPPKPRRVTIEPPTPDVVQRLLDAAERPGAALLVFLAAVLGARRGELVGLRWEDFDGETVQIARSVYELAGGGVAVKPTKTDRPRRIYTGVAIQPATGYIFSDDEGVTPWRPTRATREYELVRKLVPEAKGVRLHDLRHFHASQLIGQGYDPAVVSKRLGHANVTTTLNIYSHALDERDRDASKAMHRMLSLPSPRALESPAPQS